MCVVTCIQTSNTQVADPYLQLSTQHFLHRTCKYSAWGLDLSESKTSILDVCIRVTTHTVNNNISVNFN